MKNNQGDSVIAVLGCWEVRNYGSHLTYYALYKVLKKRGYNVLMVGCPADASYKTTGKPEYFYQIPYGDTEMCKQFPNKIAMRELNRMAKTFIVGSDQLWYPALYRYFGKFAYLDFIFDNKKKISYATSFGKSNWVGSEAELQLYASYLRRFDFVSVRESSGVSICENVFGVKAEWMLDPVFLCDSSVYSQLADKSPFVTSSVPYIAAYILDCDDCKAERIANFSYSLNCEYQILKDPNLPIKIKKKWNQVTNFCVEDWLKWIRDSNYVITDSFHGMCVALMLRKKIIVVKNERRGIARFDDYGKMLGISNIMVSSFNDLKMEMFDLINYEKIDSIVDVERQKSLEWLYYAIETEKPHKELSVFDIVSLRQDEMFSEIEHKLTKKKFCSRLLCKVKSIFSLFG